MATPADLVAAAAARGAQVKKMPSSGVRAPGSAGGGVSAYKAQPNKLADKVGRMKNRLGATGGDAARAAAGGGGALDATSAAGGGNGTTVTRRGFDGDPSARLMKSFPPTADMDVAAAAAPAPRSIQGRDVNPDGTITGANGGTQQLGAAAMRRLRGVPGGGAPPPPMESANMPPGPPPGAAAEMVNKLRGFKLATGGPMGAPGVGGGGFPGGPSDAEMAVNARPELQGALDDFQGGPQEAPPMPPGAPPQGASGLFDSLGRVGAGLPPNGGVRPRPMPFNRPANAMGGF